MDAGFEGPAWDALRAEGAWMRRLALALVGDTHAADDLVQDAWRRCAERGTSRPTRAWVAGMLRFLARERRRGDARRTRREREAARPEAQPADALDARLEVQQRVLDAVRALPLAQRDAILLRYYDELAPAEIARRLGVPEGTVRARLSRGVAELRRRLDERSGGDRAEWQLALVPWLASGGAVRDGALVGALALGGAAVKLGLVVGGACLALIAALMVWRASDAPHVAPELVARGSALSPGAESRVESPSAGEAERAELARVGAGDASSATSGVQADAEAGLTTRFAARVLDRERRPLANAGMRARTQSDGETVHADSNGRVELVVAPDSGRASSVVELVVGAPGHATRILWPPDQRGGVRWIGDVRLDPGASLAGRVVDEKGAPLADVQVRVSPFYAIVADVVELRELLGPEVDGHASARSALDGRFRFEGLPVGDVRVWARTTARRWRFSAPITLSAGDEREELVLALVDPDASDWIHGVLLDPDGGPVERAHMHWRALEAPHGEGAFDDDTATDADGRFELPALHPGPQRLVVEHPRGQYAPLVLQDVLPGVPLELRFERGVEFAVRVQDPDGRPLAKVDVAARSAATQANPQDVVSCTTDADGLAHLRSPVGEFFVVARRAGYRSAHAGPFAPRSPPSGLVLTLRRGKTLQGRVLADGVPLAGALVTLHADEPPGRITQDWSTVGAPFFYRLDPQTAARATTDVDGLFALPLNRGVRGAPSNRWRVRSVHAEHPHAIGEAFSFVPELALDDLVLEHAAAGALEGTLLLPPDTEPAGYIVRVASEDGVVLERELGPDGKFHFDALRPGPWQIAAFEPGDQLRAELTSPAPKSSVHDSHHVQAGATARVDIDHSQARIRFEGRVVLRGAPQSLMSVLVSCGRENLSAPLDDEGRFELEFVEAGEITVVLRIQNAEGDNLWIVDQVDLRENPVRWELDLAVGSIAGTAVGSELVHEWGLGDAPPFASTRVPIAKDGSFGPALVPAGPGVLLTGGLAAFGREPERDLHAHSVVVPVGELLRVELR